MGEKLIIHNRDGSKTEVEPLKMWQPDESIHDLYGERLEEWLSKNFRMGDGSALPRKPYGSDMTAAWELMTIMSNRGKRPRIYRVAENEWSCQMDLDEPAAFSSSAPIAICRAVILSLSL